MIVARVRTKTAGQARLLIVLSAENVAHLQAGQSIHIAKSVLEPCGIKGLTLDLETGADDVSNARAITQRHGVYPQSGDEG